MYDGIFLTGHPYLEAAAFAVICAGIVAFLIVGAPRIIYYRIRFGKASVIVADFVQRASEDNDDFIYETELPYSKKVLDLALTMLGNRRDCTPKQRELIKIARRHTSKILQGTRDDSPWRLASPETIGQKLGGAAVAFAILGLIFSSPYIYVYLKDGYFPWSAEWPPTVEQKIVKLTWKEKQGLTEQEEKNIQEDGASIQIDYSRMSQMDTAQMHRDRFAQSEALHFQFTMLDKLEMESLFYADLLGYSKAQNDAIKALHKLLADNIALINSGQFPIQESFYSGLMIAKLTKTGDELYQLLRLAPFRDRQQCDEYVARARDTGLFLSNCVERRSVIDNDAYWSFFK